MNGFGEQTVAAITTAYRVDTVIFLPIINFGSGIATIVAQNVGAGDQQRAQKAFRTGVLIMTGISLTLTIFVLLLGELLISIFGLTAESVEIGKDFFYSIAGFYLIYGLSMAIRGYLEGTGDMLFSGAAGVLSLLVRIACSYGFRPVFGNMVVAYAEAFSWIFLLAMFFLRYVFRQRKPKEERDGTRQKRNKNREERVDLVCGRQDFQNTNLRNRIQGTAYNTRETKAPAHDPAASVAD